MFFRKSLAGLLALLLLVALLPVAVQAKTEAGYSSGGNFVPIVPALGNGQIYTSLTYFKGEKITCQGKGYMGLGDSRVSAICGLISQDTSPTSVSNVYQGWLSSRFIKIGSVTASGAENRVYTGVIDTSDLTPGTYNVYLGERMSWQVYGSTYLENVYYMYFSVNIIDRVINPTAVSLANSAVTVAKGQTQALTATIAPANATNRTLTWTSSAPTVAKVSQSGVVTGISKGTATITVKTSNGKTATCKVTVNIPATALSLSLSKFTLLVGKTYTVKATMTPSTTTDTVRWSSSDTAVATVGSATGVITSRKPGKATIIARTPSGQIATCKVTVWLPATAVKLDTARIVLAAGKSQKLIATLTPSNANAPLSWTSSDPVVAKVSSTGLVTALKKGTAIVTLKTANGKIATCKVIVTN